MRIFYLITKSEAGGAQTHIYQLSRYFLDKSCQVGVMSRPGGWLDRRVKEIRGRFYPNPYLSNSPHPVAVFKAIKEIREVVGDFQPNLISCHSTVAGILGRVAVKNRIPTIFTAHGWGFTRGAPWGRKYPVIFAEKYAARYCSRIICVSDFDRNLALRYKIADEDKLATVHNGVETDKTKRRVGLKNLDPDNVKIVFVGRLSKQKDPMLLLHSFCALSSVVKNKAQVFIVGDGPKRRKLEYFIKENSLQERVRLLGNLPREKVFEVLRGSDIFVLTSNWEGFPRTILEAMSCGLPVIATDVGGVREAVSEDCGILVKRRDKEGLKQALERLISNPELIRKMGQKARERVEREFSLEKMCERTYQVYREVVHSSS